MTADAQARIVTNQRGTRDGEALAVFSDGGQFTADVDRTQLRMTVPRNFGRPLSPKPLPRSSALSSSSSRAPVLGARRSRIEGRAH